MKIMRKYFLLIKKFEEVLVMMTPTKFFTLF